MIQCVNVASALSSPLFRSVRVCESGSNLDPVVRRRRRRRSKVEDQ